MQNPMVRRKKLCYRVNPEKSLIYAYAILIYENNCSLSAHVTWAKTWPRRQGTAWREKADARPQKLRA
jgi:hypothetical protein